MNELSLDEKKKIIINYTIDKMSFTSQSRSLHPEYKMNKKIGNNIMAIKSSVTNKFNYFELYKCYDWDGSIMANAFLCHGKHAGSSPVQSTVTLPK